MEATTPPTAWLLMLALICTSFFGANVITLDGNVTVQGVAVGGDLANHVFASGFGRLLAEVVNVGGNVSVKGTAQNSNGVVQDVIASADFEVASAFTKSTSDHTHVTRHRFGNDDVITLGKNLTVEANAKGGAVQNTAHASAFVDLAGASITVDGKVIDEASATGKANGEVRIHASAGFRASGSRVHFSSAGTSYNIVADPARNDITFKGLLDVQAKATHDAFASAFLHIDAGTHLALAGVTDKATASISLCPASPTRSPTSSCRWPTATSST